MFSAAERSPLFNSTCAFRQRFHARLGDLRAELFFTRQDHSIARPGCTDWRGRASALRDIISVEARCNSRLKASPFATAQGTMLGTLCPEPYIVLYGRSDITCQTCCSYYYCETPSPIISKKHEGQDEVTADGPEGRAALLLSIARAACETSTTVSYLTFIALTAAIAHLYTAPGWVSEYGVRSGDLVGKLQVF